MLIHRVALQETLQLIHNLGILHGDLRPANVIIGENDCTIVDFDLAEFDQSERSKRWEMEMMPSLFSDL